MATYKLGKLKINRSEDGLAFRFGEGKIHRLGFGGKKGEAVPEYDEERYYGEAGDDYAPEGYNGRFAEANRRDSYEFDEEYDDDYQDGYYDEGDYEEPYDDGYGDGYGDEYADGDYYEEGEYDDRYSDEDADAYGDDGYGYASESPLMRYVEENDWVTYLLLVILPPLGIYLLWRRRMFERPIRWVVSAISAIWFIVILILIFSAIFSGSGDTTKDHDLVLTSPTPTAAVEVEVTATPEPGASANDPFGTGVDIGEGIQPAATADALAPDATATPIASANVASGTGNVINAANTVVMPATGSYYHLTATCANIEAGASLSNVTKDVAEARGKAACPLCYPNQKTYYATSGGKYYHVDQNCSNMEGASVITKEAAVEQGKEECPACIKGKVQSLANGALRFANSNTRDRSGITVYATTNGKYFHNSATCSGMKDAVSGSLLKALLAGKEACPRCCASAATKVYCTQNGTYYHNASDCSGMENAFQVTLGEALVLGKKRCSECLTGTVSVGATETAESGDDSGIYVYGTKNGTYYHTNANCSGMSGASRYTLKSMLVAGRPACPECCSGADTTVYATSKGTYYHSFATCSGMKNATSGTLASALAYGYEKCPECWSSADDKADETIKNDVSPSGTYVYATKEGKYYHLNKNCNGMSGASKIALETAKKYNKAACPDCAEIAKRTVYSMKYGKYYHKASKCESQSGMIKRTLAEALVKGQTACPVCLSSMASKEDKSSLKVSDTYTAGTSGIKVYATTTSSHFHTKADCSGMTGASRITLETALNYGKTACTKCASEARDTVYAVKGGKYYHTSKACAGDGATSGSRAEALAFGFDACPVCVTKTKVPESSNTYKSGTSGLNVYAALSGKYYHRDKTCAGASASKVTLETALNYGKTACPSCAAAAEKNVYSSGSDKYYHSSRSCAGNGATAGDFAKAVALGKKECPVCIGGSEAYEESDVKYSAPASTVVYVDLDSDMLYYHKSYRCGDAGMSGGTKQTLEFVLDLNYKACPFCTPPTSVA